MDVVFVNPGAASAYQSLANDLTAIEPPIWAGMLATYARDRGCSVQIIDANADNLSPEDVSTQIEIIHPLLVCVVVAGQNPSASTPTMPAAGAICWAIKERNPEQKILMVGGHIAALPVLTLLKEATDFACSGESFETVVNLARVLRNKWPLEEVPDLYVSYRTGKVRTVPSFQCGDKAPLIEEIPAVAWDLLPMEKYRAHNWHAFTGPREPYASIFTSLGCPYRCGFCCVGSMFGGPSYRTMPVDQVIAQIDLLVNQYGVRSIKIADEMFLLQRERTIELCDRLIERDYGLNLWAYSRVDTLQELDRLQKAGFKWLALGIESANKGVLKGVRKGYRDLSEIKRIGEAGINLAANYIFGLPDDTQETMQETLDLACEINAEWANLYCCTAYPGSQLYREAKNEDLPDSWDGYAQLSPRFKPLPTKHLSAVEVLRFRDAAWQHYFTRSEYLDLVEKKFGTRQQVEDMTKIELKRYLYD